jgi:hypothetical protein
MMMMMMMMIMMMMVIKRMMRTFLLNILMTIVITTLTTPLSPRSPRPPPFNPCHPMLSPQAALRVHPDKCPPSDLASKKKFQALAEAYQVGQPYSPTLSKLLELSPALHTAPPPRYSGIVCQEKSVTPPSLLLAGALVPAASAGLRHQGTRGEAPAIRSWPDAALDHIASRDPMGD